jgi:hypothetical protein
VVHDQQQHVVELAEAKQRGAEERPAGGRGDARLLGDETARFPLRALRAQSPQVHDGRWSSAVRPHDLQRAPFDGGERGAQARLSLHDRGQAPPQRFEVQLAAQPERWTTL